MSNQRDVARAAGVSSATVSRYLNNPAVVSPKVAEQIRKAVIELDYRVDPSAQALRMGKSRHVGVICPGGGPFHWAAFTAAQTVLHRAGYFSTLYVTSDDDGTDRLDPLLRGRQIDGALLFPTLKAEDDEALEQLVSWGRPCVVLDRPMPHSTFPQVYIDNYHAGRQAARELLDRGHQDFLFIWGIQDFSSAQNRFTGFRDELKKAGIQLGLDRQIEGEFYSLRTYEEAKRRWAQLPPFTAVFASNDSSAAGFLKAAGEKGLQAPRDFSLVGFDNNFEFTLLFDPPLATFDQPGTELGRQGALLLLDLLEDRPVEQPRRVLEARFIMRESLGPAPAGR
jgi:DNA-binding LacI/PurR family transcriptional regulator